jgi:hypothetical protein
LEFHRQITTIVGAGSYWQENWEKKTLRRRFSHLARPTVGVWVNAWGDWVSVDKTAIVRPGDLLYNDA